ncbi:MAG TPA: TetR/AcrR family transcriptional regulator [Pseudonocardia sp.]|jgi:AcrR family transcriptional regulator
MSGTVDRCGPGAGACPARPRRRGAALNEAIYRATLDELAAVGYAELTMDGVAARARAGKGSLYRRWSNRSDLVVDAMRHLRPERTAPPDTGDLRAELLAVLRDVAEQLAGPRGEALRGLVAEVRRHPELLRTLRAEVVDSTVPPMLEVLRRGVVRGEVRPEALTPLVALVGIGLVRQQHFARSGPIDPAFVTEVVDDVVLPLVLTRQWSADRVVRQPTVTSEAY